MSSRLHRAIVAASLLVAASLSPAGAEQLLLNVKAPAGEPAPEAAPAQVNLGGGFIEFLLTGRVAPLPRREPPSPQAASVPEAPVPAIPDRAAQAQEPASVREPASAREPAPGDPQGGDVTIVDYSGPIEPGSVILNVTKREVYRILPEGKMAIYRNDETQIRLARAILKQTGR